MHGDYRESRAGFTLVEVLVVLAIVALLSAIAIPGLAKLGAFSRDEFKRATNETFSVLRAAQLYSTTYNVNAAVVYSMDHWSLEEASLIDADPAVEDPGDPRPLPPVIPDPIVDSLTGWPVRQIEAAAIMYQLPSTMGPLAGTYVPIPGELGEFRPLPPGMSILLQDPDPEFIDTSDPVNPFYRPFYLEPGFRNYRSTALVNRVGGLGMTKVYAALGIPTTLQGPDLLAFANNPANYAVESFAAHVFRSSGRLIVPQSGANPECGNCTADPQDCGICARERFTLYVAPSADRPADERLVEPENNNLSFFDANGVERSNLRYKEIHIFKSTGRIAVPQDF